MIDLNNHIAMQHLGVGEHLFHTIHWRIGKLVPISYLVKQADPLAGWFRGQDLL